MRRGAIASLQVQAAEAESLPLIPVDFSLCHARPEAYLPTDPVVPFYHDPEEEIARGMPELLISTMYTCPPTHRNINQSCNNK